MRAGLVGSLKDSAQALLVERKLPPERRDAAGTALALLVDQRPGVGLRTDGLPADGLPDIDWVKIPKTDPATGQREFIYQGDERRTEPTFWMARYSVTDGQFQAFLDADDGFYSDEWWVGLSASEGDRSVPGEQEFKHWNHPRENVSWYDAIAFCRWLTAMANTTPALAPQMPPGEGMAWRFTLPTEWQWEKAARGHDGRAFPWGDEYVSGRANINETYSDQRVGDHYLQKTSAVGMYPQGVSPYGIHDMSGNVWEWCLNEYSNLSKVQESGDANRSLRGGSWNNYSGFGAERIIVCWVRRSGITQSLWPDATKSVPFSIRCSIHHRETRRGSRCTAAFMPLYNSGMGRGTTTTADLE